MYGVQAAGAATAATKHDQLVVNDGVFSYWGQMVCFIGDVDCIAKIYLADSK